MKIATIDEVLATRVRKLFAYRINFDQVGYETLPKMREWCDEHCEDRWNGESVHALYFQFESERDATMFMLRWGGAEGNKLK